MTRAASSLAAAVGSVEALVASGLVELRMAISSASKGDIILALGGQPSTLRRAGIVVTSPKSMRGGLSRVSCVVFN